jgi:hypothetical protein
MALVAQLETELGKPIAEIIDEADVLARAALNAADLGRSFVLKYIDPYANTVFNRGQAIDFLRDLGDVRAEHATEPEVLTFLAELERLVRQCADANHLYIRFIGD